MPVKHTKIRKPFKHIKTREQFIERANTKHNGAYSYDKVQFEDFTFRFLVDENLENYMEIYNWIRGLGYPESLDEIYKWQQSNESFSQPHNSELNLFSDATLQILTSKENPNFKVIFQDMFPTELSTLNFDATTEDIQYFTADATFKYTIYNITDMSGNKL